MLEFCAAPGERLMTHIYESVEAATRNLYAAFAQPPQPCSWSVSAWANINRRGDFNQVHTHPGVTWSGVYYVDAGAPDANAADTGLQIFDPNSARSNLFFPDLSVSNLVFKPEPGAMLIFPSYVPHAVPPHQGSGTRISIAFNARKEPFP